MAKIKAGTYRFNDVLSVPSGGADSGVFDFTTEALGYIVHCNNLYAGVRPELTYVVDSAPSELEEYLGSLGIALPFPFLVFNGERWSFTEYGVAIKTITIPKDTDVSDEFEPWFTANTKRLSTITYNGSTIATLNGGQTATLKCKGMKMQSDVVVDVVEQNGGSGTDANIVPLLVGDAGTYGANSPVIVTETWDGSESFADATTIFFGLTLPYAKSKKLVADDKVYLTLANPACTVSFDGTLEGEPLSFTLPISELTQDFSKPEGVILKYNGLPIVFWLADAEYVTSGTSTGFADNSVYILDLWTVAGATGTLTLTVPGTPEKPVDGFMPVEVVIPFEDLEITPKSYSLYRSGYYKNVVVKEIPTRRLTITPSMAEQTFSYQEDSSGAYVTEDKYKWFDRVKVEAVDITKMKVLCDIEMYTLPKTEYQVGDLFDTSGGVIKRHYTDGSVAYINIHNLDVYGWSKVNGVGTYTLVVQQTVDGITCRTTYDITVTDGDDTGDDDTGGDTGGGDTGGDDSGNTADYTVSVGDYFSIAYDGSSPAVECPSCLEYQDDGGELVFTGVSVGSGTIKLIRSSEVYAEYTVEVTA